MSDHKLWKRERERKPKPDSSPFMVKDGQVMAIVRPLDPQLKMDRLRMIEGMDIGPTQQAAFQALLNQPHKFVGRAAKTGRGILDGEGKEIDIMREGDSFVSLDEWLNAAQAPPELVPQTEKR